MTPQQGIRPQFSTSQMNRQNLLTSVGAQGTSQQLSMQQVQQPVQRTGGGLSQVPVFYDKSGLTQQQILSQHLQQPQPQPQPQQPLPQHQLQTQNMMTVSQAGHQITQPLTVAPNQVMSPMPVQQQPVLPGKYSRTLSLIFSVVNLFCSCTAVLRRYHLYACN